MKKSLGQLLPDRNITVSPHAIMLIIESILFFILYFYELNKSIYKLYVGACLDIFKL